MKKREEQEFIAAYNPGLYDRPSVAADFLLFTIVEDRLKVLMVRRNEMPFLGQLAFPGVFVGMKETPEEAALRGIREEAGIEEPVYLEQLYTWGDVDRDPRMRVLSVSYMALVPQQTFQIKSGLRVSEAGLFDVEELLLSKEELAFDHRKMLSYARERIRNKTEYSTIAFHFVGEEFTLPQLQRVYEILLGKSLYKANFRKKIIELVEATDKMETGEAHRPSRIYVQKIKRG